MSWGWKSAKALVTGTVSRTARVSGATRNLKEAVGKIPARRTGTAYEAGASERGGRKIQGPIVTRENVEANAAGLWDEGHASYPGISVVLFSGATGVARRRDGAATNAQGDVYAVDVNPTQIVSAREAAGLTSVGFLESGFGELLTLDLPPFDCIALHGMYSWVDADRTSSPSRPG